MMCCNTAPAGKQYRRFSAPDYMIQIGISFFWEDVPICVFSGKRVRLSETRGKKMLYKLYKLNHFLFQNTE